MNPLVRVVGVGDLILVQQKKVEYRAAEIAHIANVLAGESNTREHKRTTVEERLEETETILEEEQEKDLQTAEKFELQRESETTITENLELEGALRISASYGPMVQVETNFGVRSLTSAERRSKTATKFAREVTERSVERIRTKQRTLRRARFVQTIEELNKHELTNATTEHQVGVYRWVDKIYFLQNYRYGLRLMVQCVVPEPGTLLRILQARGALPAGFDAVAPPPFDLEIEDIQRDTYADLVARWNASDVPEPPPEKVAVPYTANFKLAASDEVAVTGKVQVPRGYQAKFFRGKALMTHTPLHTYGTSAADIAAGIKVTVGTMYADLFLPASVVDRVDPFGWEFYSAYGTIGSEEAQGELPVAISVQYQALAIAVALTVSCDLTDEGEDLWRTKVYEALYSAYAAARSRYEEQVAVARASRGGIVGRSPSENRKRELVELKRSAIEMLRETAYSNWHALVTSTDGYPNIDATGTTNLRTQIDFLERAFEWENVAFNLLPYFWGDRTRWGDLWNADVPDPLHSDFLGAGAGVINVPVMPGYELLVLHYLYTDGDIWTEVDPPPTAEEFQPLVGELDRIAADGTAIDNPLPEGLEWTERVPTELVTLKESELPIGPIDIS